MPKAFSLKRMPPQPTNTRLARFVRRAIDHLPWVAIAQRDDARLQFLAEKTKVGRLQSDIYQLRHDMLALMQRDALPVPSFRASAGQEMAVDQMMTEIRTTVCYEPLHIATSLTQQEIMMAGRSQMQNLTEQIVKENARRIAHMHAERHAEDIYQRTVAMINRPRQGQKT